MYHVVQILILIRQFKLQKMNERQNVRIFLQSLRTLPEETKQITLAEANAKIQNSNDDVFSIYELILQLRGTPIHEHQRMQLSRRLLSLISLISSQYKIYYTKLEILKSFWEDAGIDNKMELKFQWENSKFYREKKDEFVLTVLRDEHYYHIVRFCNIFIKESLWQCRNHEQNYSVKIYLMHLSFSHVWKNSREKIKKIISCHKHESFVKIKLSLEYCKFLLNFNLVTLDHRDIEENFDEFLLSIKLCLRLIKKLYSIKIQKYIPVLKEIIKSSVYYYRTLLPYEKMKNLMKLHELLAKEKPTFKINMKNKLHFSLLLNLVSKIVHSWQKFLEIDSESSKSIDEKIQENTKIIFKIHEQKKKTKNQDRFTSELKKNKFELRKKKAQSLHLSSTKNKYLNQYQIKAGIKVQIAKEFDKRNFMKFRVNSQNIIPHRKSDSKEKKNSELKEVKIEEYINPVFMNTINKKAERKFAEMRSKKASKLRISLRGSKHLDLNKIIEH